MARRRAVRRTDALEDVGRSLERVKKLMDACDAWLQDPDQPDRYDLGLRASECTVLYEEEDENGAMRRKHALLSTLLGRLGGQIGVVSAAPRSPDVRILLLKTAQELRQCVTAAVDLARALSDYQAMEQFQQAILEEIAKTDAESARRIAERVRNCLVLQLPVGGTAAVSARRGGSSVL